ncbi:hypothetical protein F443_10325, partial [Phytophthora nicotianae P1569]
VLEHQIIQFGAEFDACGAAAYDLKNVIKANNPVTIRCDAKELLLFLAKKDEMWLDEAGAAAVELDALEYSQAFELMDPPLRLNNARYFGANFKPSEGEIHVLVVVPKATEELVLPAFEYEDNQREQQSDGAVVSGDGIERQTRKLSAPLQISDLTLERGVPSTSKSYC